MSNLGSKSGFAASNPSSYIRKVFNYKISTLVADATTVLHNSNKSDFSKVSFSMQETDMYLITVSTFTNSSKLRVDRFWPPILNKATSNSFLNFFLAYIKVPTGGLMLLKLSFSIFLAV